MLVMLFHTVEVSTACVPRVLSLHLRLTWLHINLRTVCSVCCSAREIRMQRKDGE